MGRELSDVEPVHQDFNTVSSETKISHLDQIKERGFDEEFEKFAEQYRDMETGIETGNAYNFKSVTNKVRDWATVVDMLPLDWLFEADTVASTGLAAGAGLADGIACVLSGDFRGAGEELICVPVEAAVRATPGAEYVGLLEWCGLNGWDPHDIARQWTAKGYRGIVGGQSGIISRTDEELAEMFIKAKDGQSNHLTKDVKPAPGKPKNFVSVNLANPDSNEQKPDIQTLDNDGLA